jgi:hypothetical protein
MTAATLLPEWSRARAEASVKALNNSSRPIRAADARQIVALALSATEELRYTWEYPRRALGEGGIETAAFRELCFSVLAAIDWHLKLLTTVIRLDEEVLEGAEARSLEEAQLRVQAARKDTEELLAFLGKPFDPIDWGKVREAEGAFESGQYTRLNPEAKGV